jgi:response regulator RpfG family c-di-GMP phosphodiesterase
MTRPLKDNTMSQASTILIVDDEPLGQETLSALLAGHGYHLAFASNGQDALAQTAALTPDLILLDVMMPDLNGFDVCRQLRADPRLAEVPIILVTALDDRDARLRGIEAGADDFVSKPFDRAELRARIRTITRLNRYRQLHQERAKAAGYAQRQIERLAALRAIDVAIVSSLDLAVTLNVILDQVTSGLHVDAAAVLLRKPHTQMLEYALVRGVRQDVLPQTSLRFGEGCAGYIALHRQPLLLPDAAAPEAAPCDHPLCQEGFVAYYGVPLIVKGQVEGVLEIFHRAPLGPSQEWQGFLDAFAAQTAVAIDHAALFHSMQRAHTELLLAYDTTLEGWARALELRDKETEGHAQRVTTLTLQLAQAMGLNEAEQVHMRRGALLHDIGKMGIPDSILLKPGPLTDDEWEVMRRHPVYAYDLLAPISYLRPVLDIPHYHHERWDGTGYPHGLKGEQIPLAARIFAVIDVWDALRFDRPYRKGWPEARVREHVRELAGTHFDPRGVEVFLKHVVPEESTTTSAILVVDDEEGITQSLSRGLGDLFTVFTANSGEEALAIITREPIAVILTDQRMPGLSGVQFLEQAKRIRPAALGMLSSGYFDQQALDAALNLGTVRGYLHKPWRLAEVRRRVAEVVQHYQAVARSRNEIHGAF